MPRTTRFIAGTPGAPTDLGPDDRSSSRRSTSRHASISFRIEAQRLQQGGEFVVGFHQDTVDGEDDAVSIMDEIGRMGIEDGDLIEIAIE